MNEQPQEIIWSAPEFQYYEKDISWYWLSIIGAGVIFLIALWQKNLLFGIFVILAEGLIIFWAKEFPREVRFRIDKKGLRIDESKTYLYENLGGFHIIEGDNGASELILKTKSKLHPYLKIILAYGAAQEIGDFLKNHLEEIEYEESLSDGISRMIGF